MGIMVGIGIDLVVILLLKDKDLIMNGKFKSKIMWIIVIKVYRKYIYLFRLYSIILGMFWSKNGGK